MISQETYVTRWQALKSLWLHRSYWRLSEPRQIMRTFRDEQLSEIMPFVVVMGLLAGGVLFVLIPSVLPEQAAALTSVVWPTWVATAAPMICAQIMAMLIAPMLALDLIHKHETGYFQTINTAYGAPAGYPCISWIVALSAVCVVANFVLILCAMLFGLGLALMFAVGDVRATWDAVLLAAPPIKWVRSGASAAILGAVCGLSVVLHAWPGTQLSNAGGNSATHAHRLGLRVMLVCSLVLALTGFAINGIVGLFDRPL